MRRYATVVSRRLYEVSLHFLADRLLRTVTSMQMPVPTYLFTADYESNVNGTLERKIIIGSYTPVTQ